LPCQYDTMPLLRNSIISFTSFKVKKRIGS